MSKTSVFTNITPLPPGITRQAVIDTYHNHFEMIDLNPLVIDRFKCKAPGFAPADEFHATWYTIKDKISYLPGGLASGSVSYHACFHDLPDALQTHVYAPLGLEIKAKWTVGGSLPGEPKQAEELGLGIPKEGLYIREDIKMKCNIMMISFVKKTFKEAHSKLVDRLVEKAHKIEREAANERARNPQPTNLSAPSPALGAGSPADRHISLYSNASSGRTVSPLASPGLQHTSTFPAQPPMSPPYSAVDPAYQNMNPNYGHDPRVSQIIDIKNDPRYSMYQSPQRTDTGFAQQPQQPDQKYQAYQPPQADRQFPRWQEVQQQRPGQQQPGQQQQQHPQNPQHPGGNMHFAAVELPTVRDEPAELAG